MPQAENHESSKARAHPKQVSRQRVPSTDRSQAISGPAAAMQEPQHPWESLLGSDYSQRTFERHATLLGDSRMSHRMYRQQRAMIVRQLQRDYGNRYVQRLVDHIQKNRTDGVQTKTGSAEKQVEQQVVDQSRGDPQDEAIGKISVSDTQGTRPSGQDTPAVQSLVSNDATGSRIRLLSDKPDAPLRQWINLYKLEKAARDNDKDAAFVHMRNIFAAKPLYMADLLRYKLEKHRNNAAKLAVYTNVPADLGAMAFRLAVENEDAVPIHSLINYLSDLNAGERLDLATGRAAFFINHVLATAKGINPNLTVTVLQDTALMAYLKANAATDYATFAAATPQLNVVEQIQGAGVLQVGADNRGIVDAIFNAIIHNTSISVAYYGSQLTPVDYILSGDTQKARTDRANTVALLQRIDPNRIIPTIPATDCHHLLLIFQSIVSSYPGLNVSIARQTEPTAVLTAPLTGTPGGLIANTCQGNTFDDAGALTSQIFFSGEGGVNAHSWLTIEGQDYDILFGSTGAAVAAGIAGRFKSTANPRVFKQVGANMYMVADDTLATPANPHSFNTAYRLTADPTAFGIVPGSYV